MNPSPNKRIRPPRNVPPNQKQEVPSDPPPTKRIKVPVLKPFKFRPTAPPTSDIKLNIKQLRERERFAPEKRTPLPLWTKHPHLFTYKWVEDSNSTIEPVEDILHSFFT